MLSYTGVTPKYYGFGAEYSALEEPLRIWLWVHPEMDWFMDILDTDRSITSMQL